MIVLGINAFHADASAALLRDGELVAAAEEERFRRIKHWAGFPANAIAFCLRAGGVNIVDVDHVAVNQDNKASVLPKLSHLLKQPPNLSLLLDRVRNRHARGDIRRLIDENFPGFRGNVHSVEHHLAHLSSAFHVSPFQQAAAVSIDGFGDFASASWGVGRGTEIDIRGRVHFPHSLGIFYQAITQYLGFPIYGDEYKAMGLAAYGEPSLLSAMRNIVRLKQYGAYELDLRYFRHHRESIAFQWTDGAPLFADLFTPALDQLLGPRRAPDGEITQRHRNIAASAQAMYEEAVFHLLNAVHAKSGFTDLVLAGGCAMNSVANGKIKRRTPFRRVYVPAAAGDAGGAIGAAYAVWNRKGGARSFVMDHAYWGPEANASETARLLERRRADLERSGCRIAADLSEAALLLRVASAIADGKVVGWFQGKMEWGPRALGNRSILADPRRADMKDILNGKIKRRESFRPFAPSILEEQIGEWFEESSSVPFMTEVRQIRPEKHAVIPAVCHVDGTGRPQTVSEDTNPRFYRLIKAFDELTGVPMVVNTSFNENEPIVCAPDEALDCFLRTKMDALVLDDTLIER